MHRILILNSPLLSGPSLLSVLTLWTLAIAINLPTLELLSKKPRVLFLPIAKVGGATAGPLPGTKATAIQSLGVRLVSPTLALLHTMDALAAKATLALTSGFRQGQLNLYMPPAL